MLTSGLFYVVLVSVVVLCFVGNRVTEGSKGKFGSRTVKKILGKLKKLLPETNPKLVLSTIVAMVTFAVANAEYPVIISLYDGHYNGWLKFTAMMVGTTFLLLCEGFIFIAIYYFVERLAEILTYFMPKLRTLDLTVSSRVIAFLLMICMAMGLLDVWKFSKRLNQLGRRDRTRMWLRKMAKQRQEYEARRNANQAMLKASRARWNLYHR